MDLLCEGKMDIYNENVTIEMDFIFRRYMK